MLRLKKNKERRGTNLRLSQFKKKNAIRTNEPKVLVLGAMQTCFTNSHQSRYHILLINVSQISQS